jgi:hypothetical protein
LLFGEIAALLERREQGARPRVVVAVSVEKLAMALPRQGTPWFGAAARIPSSAADAVSGRW